MSYRSDGGGPAAPASGHGAVPRLQRRPRRRDGGGARAVSGQWRARGRPARQRGRGGAEERRRGHRYGADVPTLTGPDFVLTMWGASCPDVWSRGRRASPRQRGSCLGRRRSDGGPGPTKPVRPLPSPRRGASSRTCHRPQRPRNHPPSFPRRRESRVWPQAGGACFTYATLPPQSRRASDPSTDPRDSQSKEASQSKDQPPLLPPDPLQKSEKNLKDNPKWRIN